MVYTYVLKFLKYLSLKTKTNKKISSGSVVGIQALLFLPHD